jgi:hypothetical protein
MADTDTVLTEIAACIEEVHRLADRPRPWTRETEKAMSRLQDREWNLQVAANHAFAKLNRWTVTATYFSPERLGHRNSGGDFYHADIGDHLFDHRLYFRANGKNAAFVTQPYAAVDKIKVARDYAEGLGLELHAMGAK